MKVHQRRLQRDAGARRRNASHQGLTFDTVQYFSGERRFDPLLKRARLLEAFDVAIASTKGMP
jgi:hypothetical protein